MKQILIALVIISIFGCQDENKGYSISGNVNEIEDGKIVYVSNLGPNNQPERIDSVAIENGEFSLDLPEVDQPNLSFLTIEGLNGNVMYISENEPISFEIYKDSLSASKVTGGKENELFYEYIGYLKDLNKKVMENRVSLRQELGSKGDSSAIAQLQQNEGNFKNDDLSYKKNLIEENPDSFVSVLALTDMQSIGAPVNEVKALYASLNENLQNTALAKALKENLDKMSAVEIGSKAPLFSGPNPQGEEVALKDVMGKVTLIDFWAAWCKPCRQENPNIVNVFNKYHDQGFNIVGVSLDREGQKDKWLEAIEEDNLTWTHISNLQFWQEPIAQQYGIRAIPAAFILDENGIIVAKNLRGEDLENKVRELIENQ